MTVASCHRDSCARDAVWWSVSAKNWFKGPVHTIEEPPTLEKALPDPV